MLLPIVTFFFPFTFKASRINPSLGVCTHQHPTANCHRTLKHMVFSFFCTFCISLNAKTYVVFAGLKQCRKDESVR